MLMVVNFDITVDVVDADAPPDAEALFIGTLGVGVDIFSSHERFVAKKEKRYEKKGKK